MHAAADQTCLQSTQPCLQSTQTCVSPVHSNMSPVHSNMSPVHSNMSPVHSNISPVHSNMSPVHNWPSHTQTLGQVQQVLELNINRAQNNYRLASKLEEFIGESFEHLEEGTRDTNACASVRLRSSLLFKYWLQWVEEPRQVDAFLTLARPKLLQFWRKVCLRARKRCDALLTMHQFFVEESVRRCSHETLWSSC